VRIHAELERAANDEALARLFEIQKAHDNLQLQILMLQKEIEKSRESQSSNASKITTIRANYKPILPWLPPVLFLAFAGGYGFHRVKMSKTWNNTSISEPETIPLSENVTVLVPRKRIPGFVKWLNSQ
jgi:hypothetical protein